jgi:hypothetical protein
MDGMIVGIKFLT